jgi:microcompartment protein CcmL/EutN
MRANSNRVVGRAFGFIETGYGRTALIEAVDEALKSANVDLLASYFVGGGCNCVILGGDTGSVKAALCAAEAVLSRFNAGHVTHIITRPSTEIVELIRKDVNGTG